MWHQRLFSQLTVQFHRACDLALRDDAVLIKNVVFSLDVPQQDLDDIIGFLLTASGNPDKLYPNPSKRWVLLVPPIHLSEKFTDLVV